MMQNEIRDLVQKLLPAPHNISKLEKLFGEASYREYFRCYTVEGLTFIVMKMPPGKQSVSEEITNYKGEKGELPFLNIARYLTKVDLPAPQIIGTDLSSGLIVLQDLGDQSLESLVNEISDAMRQYFYRLALDLLVKLQKAGKENPDEECMAFHRSFDKSLLLWEFEHFLEYGIEDRFQTKIPETDRSDILKEADSLIDKIIAIPYGLTHRDFQSRNLLLFAYEFFLIDFQDALLGPPQYDLVALLRDSYVNLPENEVEAALKYFWQQRQDQGIPLESAEEFRENFYRISLQRKLKDAGRFQYINTVKKNPKFLPHVPNSLSYVKHAFAQLPQYKNLAQLLAKYVPELQ